MPKKISQFTDLNVASPQDLIPILDVSEINLADKNKKITVNDLLETVQPNPYIQATCTEIIPEELPDDNILIGHNFNVSINPQSYLPEVGVIPDANFTVVGNDNSIDSPNGYGEDPSPYCSFFGQQLFIGQNSPRAINIGYNNNLQKDGADSIIIGSGSILGNWSWNDPQLQTNNNCISLGNEVTIQAGSSIALGWQSKIWGKSDDSIVIGTQAVIGKDEDPDNVTAIGPCYSAIAIGNEALVEEDYSLAIGLNTICKARYGTSVGPYSEIQKNANDAVAIGGSIVAETAEEGIAIGVYSYVNGPGSIAIGPRASCNSITESAIAIGDGAAARAPWSIVLGENSGVNINSNVNNIIVGAISVISNNSPNSIILGSNTNIFPDCTESIIIGSNSNINSNSPQSIAIGYGSLISNNNDQSIAIGAGAIVYDNSANSIALGAGAIVSTGATNRIQLGVGTNNTQNSLQFLTNTIANAEGIQAKTFLGAPTSTTAPNGTLAVDNTNNNMYFRSDDVWRLIPSTIGEINTASSLGNGFSIVGTKLASDLRFKSLAAGDGINLASTANDITISTTVSPIQQFTAIRTASFTLVDGEYDRFITINTAASNITVSLTNTVRAGYRVVLFKTGGGSNTVIINAAGLTFLARGTTIVNNNAAVTLTYNATTSTWYAIGDLV